MKFRDFKEEAAGVGIVTKQNATKDVPVGGEYANVKKLGLGKGKPKEHSKKTKGSKTNVLFNLGMAEEEYKPHMMYKGTKKDYKAKFPTKKKHHDRLNKAGYSHDDPETKKVEEGDSTFDESGIMYRAGVKKYGKDGMKKIQSAAGSGASAEEIGKIKDKYNKKKTDEYSMMAVGMNPKPTKTARDSKIGVKTYPKPKDAKEPYFKKPKKFDSIQNFIDEYKLSENK